MATGVDRPLFRIDVESERDVWSSIREGARMARDLDMTEADRVRVVPDAPTPTPAPTDTEAPTPTPVVIFLPETGASDIPSAPTWHSAAMLALGLVLCWAILRFVCRFPS